MQRQRLHIALFALSAAGIAYQVVLTRIFALAQWHHFAYMIISVAMLGFGASGTLIALFREAATRRAEGLFEIAVALLALSLPGCFALSQLVPFETYQLVSQPGQWLWLILLYLVLSVPFLLLAAAIALAFLILPKHIGRLYGFDMAGSGLGAAGVVLLLYWIHPQYLPALLALPVLVGWAIAMGRKLFVLPRLPILAAVAAGIFLIPGQTINLSQYKGLSYALDLPDAEIVAEAVSPLSVVTAVQSDYIRETPGQIGNYPMSEMGELPTQTGLYFDGGAVSPVSEFTGDLQAFAYLDYVTSAAAYRMVEQPRTLVIGAGGGSDVLSALAHDARHVTAIEVDPAVLELAYGPLRAFSGELYQREDVDLVLTEGRGFLQQTDATYDLIQLPLFGSFTAAASGVYALNESYLYTIEAFELFLSRLEPGGVLALNCWLKTPPRNGIKLFATAAAACRELGWEPAEHLAMLRSWNNATILVSEAPLSEADIAALRGFARDRSFDLAWLPDIAPDEVNQYTILEEPIYYEAARALVSDTPESFVDDYIFHVAPATDDKPYFFRFFKWESLPRLIQGMGAQWAPFVEWGYIALVATLAQSLEASLLLILLPLVRRRRETAGGGRALTFAYFAGIGLGFMFLELAFIQRFMLFLSYPVYAMAVVLTAFLVFSGLGSLYSDWRPAGPRRLMHRAVIAIALVTLLYVLIGPFLFTRLAAYPDAVRIIAGFVLLAPLAFWMGMPFPIGLQHISDAHPPLVPWAWAINGCFSVIGATLATFLGVHIGFAWVVGLAVLAYALSLAAFHRLTAQTQPGS